MLSTLFQRLINGTTIEYTYPPTYPTNISHTMSAKIVEIYGEI